MGGLIVGIFVNAALFIGISMLLPGFRIASKPMALAVAAVYGIATAIVGKLLGVALAVLLAPLFVMLAIIPIIGPLLAAGAVLPTLIVSFVLGFAVSVVVLKGTDHLIEEFEMDGWPTAIKASLLLGVGRLGTRLLLGI